MFLMMDSFVYCTAIHCPYTLVREWLQGAWMANLQTRYITSMSQNNTALSSFLFLHSFGEQFAQKILFTLVSI